MRHVPMIRSLPMLALLFALSACGGQPVAREAGAVAPTATGSAPAAAKTPLPPLVAVRDGAYEPKPPVAAIHAHDVVAPAGTRDDPYYWLRDDTRKAPEMLAYLQAERDYFESMMAPLKGARAALYQEIVGRIAQNDDSVPERKNGWYYYRRFVEGGQYPIIARRRNLTDAKEEILLDGNAMAQGHAFFQFMNYEVSDDGHQLAWVEDTVGRRQGVLRFKDLATGRMHADEIRNVEGSIAWAGDNRTVLYIEKDPVTLLGSVVRRHRLGDEVARDARVYEEKDRSYYVGVGKTRSDRYLMIYSGATDTSETRVADAHDATFTFRPLIPRAAGHQYEAEDFGDRWIIRTNDHAKNFRIVSAPMTAPADRAQWRDVVAHREDGFVHGFATFRDFLAIEEREGGIRHIRTLGWRDGETRVIGADEPSYTAGLDGNPEVDTNVLRYDYTSLIAPTTVYDYDMATGQRTERKRQPVVGDFDPKRYASEFVHATARDGTKIPVTIAYRRDTPRDGTAPLYQIGYGSYGVTYDPSFDSAQLSLLDRGVVVAIAHIRGGQELGRDWYERGRQHQKINTFTDFIDVTDFLVRERYAARDRVIAQGRSAGGLLMGAIANMAPDRYRVITAGVPFVDVVTTMLDESIPLTTNEFEEWGNPKDPADYAYMLSYSPYDNVTEQDYPAIFVSTGLWDSQVQYYEPAKWVAKLRAKKTDSLPLLFRVEMSAGHGGKSGRFARYELVADEYAFALDQVRVSLPGAVPAKKAPTLAQ